MGNPFQALAEHYHEEETHEGHACYALVRDDGPDKATKFVGTAAGGRMKGPTKDGYWVDAVVDSGAEESAAPPGIFSGKHCNTYKL